MALGPNQIRNPDGIANQGQWGAGSLGPDDWISFNGDGHFASQQSVITEAGDYKLILTYESDGWFKARVGNAPTQEVPASTGGVIDLDFTVTDPDFSGIAFDDHETAAGRILNTQLRKIT